MGKIILYGILLERAGVKEIEIETKGKKLIDIIKKIADQYNLKELLFKQGKVRPIYLIMVDGQDYLSLGLLNKEFEEEKEIRIIPVYHGGKRRNIKAILFAIFILILFIAAIVLQFIK